MFSRDDDRFLELLRDYVDEVYPEINDKWGKMQEMINQNIVEIVCIDAFYFFL